MATVYVGISGGVDSAVAAALLKQQGHRVVGCFIKIWQPEFVECTWRDDRLDAMRVSAALDIPFCEVDFSDAYRAEVIEAMLKDYSRGISPNPDVACNRAIKFGHFLKWARGEGAERIATGHHARISTSGLTKSRYRDFVSPGISSGMRFELLRGRDRQKDQSYFLWELGQEELSESLFPVGEYTKREVRAFAKQLELPVADKPDSQGLCFVGGVTLEDFLRRFIELAPGPVLDAKGREVGQHRGAPLYTIGQRHGFTLHARTSGRPQYVVGVNHRKNTIAVSERRVDAAQEVAVFDRVHWIGKRPTFPLRADAQARYREHPVQVSVNEEGSRASVAFATPHLIAPGQSLVLYDGERCLGGGTIAPWQMSSSRRQMARRSRSSR